MTTVAPAVASNITIDASVYLSDALPDELNHFDSKVFIEAVEKHNIPVFCPVLCPVEIVAALIRRTNNRQASTAIVIAMRSYQELRLVGMTDLRANATQDAAIQCRLRGADAVYVATAQEFGTTLITWDKEVLIRAATLVPVMTPSDWLQQVAPPATQTTP